MIKSGQNKNKERRDLKEIKETKKVANFCIFNLLFNKKMIYDI